ncbi:gamma-glutamylcyclotransferase family protein [Mesorhizobium sp. BAC0120]|uniref:gamma-glutamylcyclotransferase family protein n=1 Tax=Mesorhizobium sp. BAC0120 TaxID=3090670 RepID=UPI00298BEB2E|nr:gamma-glutamylcyclotransferase family protein [Mesorhizobium sp. BAC0120]MDW6022216.1 gamma-glutamylcyclotransferase family protein [Mesorhizobium sp. BAC0120]
MTLIFSYGSNLDNVQLDVRCPGHQKIGNAVLQDYRLSFPRLSEKRGCGVSSVEPAAGREVWGVVHRLNAADLDSLDRHEGYRLDWPAERNRYNRLALVVRIEGVPTEVQAYIATATPNPPAPNAAYLAHIRNGARQHGLPEHYQAFLAELQF